MTAVACMGKVSRYAYKLVLLNLMGEVCAGADSERHNCKVFILSM